MANHRIEIDILDPASIQAAQAEMNRLLAQFNQNVDVFLGRLAQVGATTAQSVYGPAVLVQAKQISKQVWAIEADGKSVVFLEFGAGDTVNTGNKYAGEVTAQGVEVRSGSWSEKHAQQYSTYGRWEFPPGSGNWLTAVAPRNAMEKAYEKIILSIQTEVRNVFK